MEVHGYVYQAVDIDPIRVIEKLIDNEISWQGWIFEKDGKYYRGYEASAGYHHNDKEKEITKETYEYVKALQLVLEYLEHLESENH